MRTGLSVCKAAQHLIGVPGISKCKNKNGHGLLNTAEMLLFLPFAVIFLNTY